MTPDQAQASQDATASIASIACQPPKKPAVYDVMDKATGQYYRFTHDYTMAKNHVEKELGMLMDWATLKKIEDQFVSLGITEWQANQLIIQHAIIVNHLFTPKSWTWPQRFKVALLFIFGRAKAAGNGK